jgi:hypothetical protein
VNRAATRDLCPVDAWTLDVTRAAFLADRDARGADERRPRRSPPEPLPSRRPSRRSATSSHRREPALKRAPWNGLDRSQRGIAMVFAVAAAIPLIGVAGTLLMIAVRQREQVEESIVVTMARDAAASGAQDAMAKLSTNADFTGTYDLAIGGGQAQVTVTDWVSDGIDNDGDGRVDDALEADYVSISSIGSVNVAWDAHGNEMVTAARSMQTTANVITKKVRLTLPVDATFYVDDPLATFTFSGTSFSIDGSDVNLDGTKGPQPALPGMGTPGDPKKLASQFSKSQKSRVTGKGGTPSVLTVADIDLVDEIHHLASLATLTWTDMHEKISNVEIGDYKNLVPVIAHAKGDLTLSGSAKGCGILVVDGDLVLSGNFDFVGVILVAGSVTFNGGGGKKNLHGALMTPGTIAGTDGSLGGSIQLQYSSQAVDILTSKLSDGVELVSWTQR